MVFNLQTLNHKSLPSCRGCVLTGRGIPQALSRATNTRDPKQGHSLEHRPKDPEPNERLTSA